MSKTQKAIMPAKGQQNAWNHGDDKELIDHRKLIAFDARRGAPKPGETHHHDDRFRTVVDARWYMGRSASSSVVYCSVWIHGREYGNETSGTGSAGGYGYHKASAAFDLALSSAGVKLVQSIHGAGDYAVTEAMRAVAKAVGYGRCPWTIV